MVTQLTVFHSPRFTGKPILVDIEFINALDHLDQYAAANHLEIIVTSASRLQGVPLGSLIYPPVSRCNHLVGHAIDIQVNLNGKVFDRDRLEGRNPSYLPLPLQSFFQQIEEDPILQSSSNDPLHIDDGLNQRNPAIWQEKYTVIQTTLVNLFQPNHAPGKPRLLYLRAKPFMIGEDVQQVQQALIQAGFAIAADGVFGIETDFAITEFQKQKGLTADGIVGDKTRSALGL